MLRDSVTAACLPFLPPVLEHGPCPDVTVASWLTHPLMSGCHNGLDHYLGGPCPDFTVTFGGPRPLSCPDKNLASGGTFGGPRHRRINAPPTPEDDPLAGAGLPSIRPDSFRRRAHDPVPFRSVAPLVKVSFDTYGFLSIPSFRLIPRICHRLSPSVPTIQHVLSRVPGTRC
jgi:hypothetical protein